MMRFLNRTNAHNDKDKRVAATNAEDLLELGDDALPVKAERVLGTNGGRFPRRRMEKEKQKDATEARRNRDHFQNLRDEEQKSLWPLLQTQEPLLDSMPDASTGGLRPWPPIQQRPPMQLRPAQDLLHARGISPRSTSRYASSLTVNTPEVRREVSDLTLRSHYDAKHSPLQVSQQTSASAIRDMALRKGSPMIRKMSSESNVKQHIPKSAMKTQKTDTVQPGYSNMSPKSSPQSSKNPKKLDLPHLFLAPKHSNGSGLLLSPSKFMNSPSNLTSKSEVRFSEQFTPETVKSKLNRPAPNLRFETSKSGHSLASSYSEATTRNKIFEHDIFDTSKFHVRRPRKGTTNWFDAFDISSGDEEIESEEDKVTSVSPKARHGEPLLEFTPAPGPGRARAALTPRITAPNPVQDNLLAIQQPKKMMKAQFRVAEQHGGSGQSSIVNTHASPRSLDHRSEQGHRLTHSRGSGQSSIVNTHASPRSLDHRSEQGTRLTHSRFQEDRSVLSLSSSEDEKEDTAVELPPTRERLQLVSDVSESNDRVLGGAPQVGVERLAQRPHQLQTRRSSKSMRQSTESMGSSSSIPVVTGDMLRPTRRPALPPDRILWRRNTTIMSNHSDPTNAAEKALHQHVQRPELPPRAATDTHASSLMLPTASAQQKYQDGVGNETNSSFPLDATHMMAVTEEEMALLEMMRRKRAAMQENSFSEGYKLALKQEQEHLTKRRLSAAQTAVALLKKRDERNKSGRESRQSDDVDEGAGPLGGLNLGRLSKVINTGEVDKAFKIEQFVASDFGPTAGFPGTPASETLPQIEEQSTPEEDREPEYWSAKPYSHANAKKTASIAAYDADAIDARAGADHILSSSNPSEPAFPSPPTRRKSDRERRTKRGRRTVLLMSATEEEISANPERSPSRPDPLFAQAASEPPTSPAVSPPPNHANISEPRRRSYVSTSNPLVDTVMSLHNRNREEDPYQHSANLNFQPLDFPIPGYVASPSMSTSHASPLTPTFPPTSTASERERRDVHAAGSSDGASFRSQRPGANTPDTDLSLHATGTSPGPRHYYKQPRRHESPTALPNPLSSDPPSTQHSASAKVSVKPKPAPLDSYAANMSAGLQRVGSIRSVTSAGEDVLAAWSALGGGRDAYHARKLRIR